MNTQTWQGMATGYLHAAEDALTKGMMALDRRSLARAHAETSLEHVGAALARLHRQLDGAEDA